MFGPSLVQEKPGDPITLVSQPDGPKLKLRGFEIWGVERGDLYHDQFAANLYSGRQKVVQDVINLGANCILLRYDTPVPFRNISQARIQQILEWVDITTTAGLYVILSCWAPFYTGPSWYNTYEHSFPFMSRLVELTRGNPLVLHAPWGAPKQTNAGWAMLQTPLIETIRLLRYCQYNGVIILPTAGLAYNHQHMASIETIDAMLPGNNGRHQIAFGPHWSPLHCTNQVWTPESIDRQFGGLQAHHAILVKEFISLSEGSLGLGCASNAADYLRQQMTRSNVLGAICHLYGAWAPNNPLSNASHQRDGSLTAAGQLFVDRLLR